MLLKMSEFVPPLGTELLFLRVPADGLMKGPYQPYQPQERDGGRPRSRGVGKGERGRCTAKQLSKAPKVGLKASLYSLRAFTILWCSLGN